jgi:hypothetical protein
MINPETETLILPKDVCRMFPGRSGNGISLSTVWRWMLQGRKRQKLDSLIVGGTRYTSKEAVQRFVAGLNGGQRGQSAQQRDDRTREARRVEHELAAEGF